MKGQWFTGTMSKHNPRGFAFIVVEGMSDAFVHCSACPDGVLPAEGSKVRFVLAERDGRERAANVEQVDG